MIKLVLAPDPSLRAQTKPVKKITPFLLQITKEMIKLTKTFTDPEGVGLASTQIGLDGCFFVAKVSHRGGDSNFISVFNPKILWQSKRTKIYLEGCLSIPNYYGEIRRYTNIKVEYTNENNQIITQALKGIIAWIFQHEMDHLNGILFPDKVLQQKGKFYKMVGKDKTGTDIFEEVTI